LERDDKKVCGVVRMKRIISFAVLLLLLSILFTGCATEGEITLKGSLNEQSVKSGWAYSVAVYTLSSGNETTTFKVRDGWELMTGETYEFVLHHVEKDEYTAVSITQITCGGSVSE
jgi:hypothetical protein